jgi:hypothetical protein
MDRLKLHRNTLLVVTSDHGEELFEHGFIGHASTAVHATLYDEVLRIPLIFYAPSRIPGGGILEGAVRQVDIMPTILDTAGLPVPSGLSGLSLLPRIQGEEPDAHLEAVSESVSGGYQSSAEQARIMLRSLRRQDIKIVCRKDGDREDCRLFDLRSDPGETRDCSDTRPQTARALRETLHQRLAAMQARRLVLLTKQETRYGPEDVPEGATLSQPAILSPRDGSSVRLDARGGRIEVRWTGDEELTYVIQYDVGKGWRNLKGSIPVPGTGKVFGPLPREAWEPLPYWNPYRIRVSPYGLDEYWSDWVEFTIAAGDPS